MLILSNPVEVISTLKQAKEVQKELVNEARASMAANSEVNIAQLAK